MSTSLNSTLVVAIVLNKIISSPISSWQFTSVGFQLRGRGNKYKKNIHIYLLEWRVWKENINIFLFPFLIEAELKIISYFSLNPRSILISPFNFNFSNRELYQADMFFLVLSIKRCTYCLYQHCVRHWKNSKDIDIIGHGISVRKEVAI